MTTPEAGDRLHLEIERLLDGYRRSGVGETVIQAALRRSFAGSAAIVQAGASFGMPGGDRRRG